MTASTTLTLNEEIVIPEKVTAEADRDVADYEENGNTFNFSLSQGKVELSLLKFTDTLGAVSILYNGSGNSPIDENGVCTLTDAGSYEFAFDILNGGVWDQDTLDQETKIIKITINPIVVAVPTAPSSKPYTGSSQPFSLVNFNNGQYVKVTGVTATNSANASTVTASDGAPWTDNTGSFSAVNADKYTITFSLRDTKNYIWGDNDGGNGTRTATFEITQKELNFTFDCTSKQSDKAVWETGETPTVTVTDGRVSGQNLSLVFYYDTIGNILDEYSTDGSVTEIVMPNNIAVGAHTLFVEFDGNTGANANYKLSTNNSYAFEVTAASVGTDYEWRYYENGTDKGGIAEGGKIPYKLNTTFSVAIVIPADQSYIEIGEYTEEQGSTVGEYKTTVVLTSTDEKNLFSDGNGGFSATTTITLNWSIIKADFDLSGIKWIYEYAGSSGKTGEYTGALEYNDGLSITIRVDPSSLPDGLTLLSAYKGSSQKEVGPYTATVNQGYLEYDNASFNEPAEIKKDWEITKKNLFTQWSAKSVTYSNDNGRGTFVTMIVKGVDEDYILYKYYDLGNDFAPVTLDDIKNSATQTDTREYRVEAYVNPDYADRYEVLSNGSTPYTTIETGSNKVIATATVNGSDGTVTPITAEYDGEGHFGAETLKITGSDGQNLKDYTVTYYEGEEPAEGKELEGLPVNAGTYSIFFTLDDGVSGDYILVSDWLVVTITPKKIAVPLITGDVVFNGELISLDGKLDDNYKTYLGMGIVRLSGQLEGRNVSAGGYTAYLTITDNNYCWAYPDDSATPVKLQVRAVAAADAVIPEIDNAVTAVYKWNISPFVLEGNSLWNLSSSTGASLKLPEWVAALATNGSLKITCRYYDDVESPALENVEFKGGNSYWVDAVLTGDDAQNFVFANGTQISDKTTYVVPMSGPAAALNAVREFMSGTLWNLPVWAWFLIGLALLILLIIIIAVACKRRKTKEEKAKKVADTVVKEVPAQPQVGMATMTMQQPVQQPVQQVQTADNSAMLRLEMEMAEIRAKLSAVQQQAPAPQQQSAPQYTAPSGGNDMIALLHAQLAEMRAEQNSMRAEQNSALKTELEIMKLRMEQKQQYALPPQLGDALVAAFTEFVTHGHIVHEQPAPAVPQIAEESTQSVPAQYPSDAVITTTTTVDTTKGSPVKRSREEDRNFDIDGFYDKFE